MDGKFYLNIALFSVDFIIILAILMMYVISTRNYHILQVPKISTYNDVIDSKSIYLLLEEFKAMYNLKGYEIDYTETDHNIKIFKNMKKRQKKIVISKRIHESVGYEIDYLVSRIWICAKQNSKDSKVISYRIFCGFVPYLLLGLTITAFALSGLVLFYGISNFIDINSEQHASDFGKFIYWLWINPIQNYLVMVFMMMQLINYYFCYRLKEIIEQEYTRETAGLIKNSLPDFYRDYGAARTYANDIKVPFILVIKGSNFWPHGFKWTGPFTLI
ncbi:hypothetical protein [Mesoplasma photuris]|uniref:hypothetical protein n=1 Tax=Mesoplasma photuris TaxID=217731 RepID=UPI0004E1128E|nr:hypothetical protein [Mesoplasma photuris]